MGQKKRSHNGGGSSSYKNMSSASSQVKSAVPSRLTVSRLEQVPELPKEYGLQKLLMGGQGMEPPNDTSSVANMSVMTVTGTVFGPGNVGVREQVSGTPAGRNGTGGGGLMDYFASQGGGFNEAEEENRPASSTMESDIM